MSARRSVRQRKQQTRLSFQPLPSSSPAKGSYSTAVQSRLANVRFGGSSSPLRKSARNISTNDRAPLPTPEPSSQPQNTLQRESSSLSDAPPTPEKHVDIPEESGSRDADSQTDEDEVVAPSSKRRRTVESTNKITPTRKSARLEGDSSPQSSLQVRSQRGRPALTSSPPGNRVLSIGSAETSGDEDRNLFTRPTSRRNTRTSQKDDPFVISDNEDVNAKVASEPTSRSRQRDTEADRFIVNDDEIEYISSDADEAVSTKRRRSSKAKKRARAQKEQDELEDDLENLQDSDQSEVIETQRTRGGPVTTQRDRNRQHLELLKRRRAGEPIPRIAESDDEDDYGFNEDDGADIDQIADEIYSRGARYQSERGNIDTGEDEPEYPQNDFEEGEEDDFVVEDDELQPLNGARSGIPLAFTSFASRKPRELFVHIVEWLVKNKIAPAFSRDDELYVLSWNKINDQIKAQAGSRLISSAWNQDFKYAIMARPQMEVHHVNEGNDEFFLNCDACNRTNHPARYEFRFSGHAYHKDTLEPIEEDDDDDSDAEEDGHANDNASYDQQGHLLPSSRRTYNLGRFCAANAEMGHKLTHWKYHLNQSLLSYLEEQGVLSAEAVVAREKLNKRKREKEADNIVDLMQETGKIDELWRGLQDDLEDARYGMEDHVARGGKRSQNRVGKVRVNRTDGRGEEWSERGQTRLVIPSDSEGE